MTTTWPASMAARLRRSLLEAASVCCSGEFKFDKALLECVAFVVDRFLGGDTGASRLESLGTSLSSMVGCVCGGDVRCESR